jgi:sortase A
MRKLSVIVSVLAIALSCAGGGSATTGTRLLIPRIHLDAPVGSQLNSGPAFYPGSARPGQPYTIAIAGHRTTHTRPFWALNELRRGDKVVLVWHGVRHTYVVTRSEVVAPTNWTVVRDVGHEQLVLSTCTPRFTARSRLVVFAAPASADDEG